MARYTCCLTVAVALENLYQNLTDMLRGCNLEILFSQGNCVLAREKPGQVPFEHLVTVEVLVDQTRSEREATDFDLVVKNGELPLQSSNHCSQIYQQILKDSAAYQGWQFITTVAK
ncbi:MAG: hypothetical protein AAF329_24820 [Cyanobacteria bacterium P01_A01_bin.17]